jgi:hypothetical protein
MQEANTDKTDINPLTMKENGQKSNPMAGYLGMKLGGSGAGSHKSGSQVGKNESVASSTDETNSQN